MQKNPRHNYIVGAAALVVVWTLMVGFLVRQAVADTITAAFPGALNNFTENDIVEDEDLNAIEAEIGIRSAANAARTSLNWRVLNASFGTTSLMVGTTATTTISGNSTSTFAQGVSATYLGLTGSSATNTAANGFNLTAGCYSVRGTCITNYSGAIANNGTTNRVPYYSGSATLDAVSWFVVDVAAGSTTVATNFFASNVIATSSLTVKGNLLASASSTFSGNLFVGGKATTSQEHYFLSGVYTKVNVQSCSGACTVNFAAGKLQRVNMTGNVTLTYSGLYDGYFELTLCNDGSQRTVTFPSNSVWYLPHLAGATTTFTQTAANNCSNVVIKYDSNSPRPQHVASTTNIDAN